MTKSEAEGYQKLADLYRRMADNWQDLADRFRQDMAHETEENLVYSWPRYTPWHSDGATILSSIDERAVGRAFVTRDDFLANARLMAAAPEMLEALELAYECMYAVPKSNPSARSTIAAAIGKARGVHAQIANSDVD